MARSRAARIRAEAPCAIATLEVTLPFTPRPWQRGLLDDMTPRQVRVVHRRAGKSTAIIWRGVRRGLLPVRAGRRALADKPIRVVHVLPQSVQWDRTGLWDQLMRAAQSVPGAEVQKQARRIVFPSGGIYQTGGFDNPDSWRGGYCDEFYEDEADDIQGGSLETVIEPMLADVGGIRIKTGTPKGLGRLKAAYERAKHAPGWSHELLRWQDTGVVGSIERAVEPDRYETAIQTLRSEMSEEEFAQEMECSFDAPNSGAIYGKLLQAADRDGRLCDVPYEPRLPVYTSWDLGIRDAMAIWLFQISRSGQWRFFDYDEGFGSGLDHYAAGLKARGYAYERHYLPHDVEVRELGSGKSRRHMLGELGVRPIIVVPAANPADRIAAVRAVLPKVWIDAKRCAVGLKHLWGYRRQWDERLGVFSAQPVHDAASNAADAFGTGIMGANEPRDDKRPLPRTAPQWSVYA